jgi:hypothetical protein
MAPPPVHLYSHNTKVRNIWGKMTGTSKIKAHGTKKELTVVLSALHDADTYGLMFNFGIAAALPPTTRGPPVYPSSD